MIQYGSICRIGPYTYEGEGVPPGEGDYLRTVTGRYHLIIQARPLAGNPRRLMLTCVRTDPATIEPGTGFYDIIWDQRNRRR